MRRPSQLESVARPGRYSILVPRTTSGKVILQYVDGAKAVSWFNSDHILTETVPLSKYDDSVWDYINDFLHEHAANGGHPGSPFLGWNDWILLLRDRAGTGIRYKNWGTTRLSRHQSSVRYKKSRH